MHAAEPINVATRLLRGERKDKEAMKLFALLGAGALALGTIAGAAAPAEAQYRGHGRYHHYHRYYHPRWHGGYGHHGYRGGRRHWHR